MMMSKPKQASEQEAKAKPPPSLQPLSTTPKDAVADLERRLAELSGPTTVVMDAPVDPPPVAAAPAAAAAAPVKGGKNALLARIMAAQERAKQPTAAPAATHSKDPPPSYTDDLLMMEYDTNPPAFDESFLPPPDLPPPPAFDDSLLAPTPAARYTTKAPVLQWDPMAPDPVVSAPPAPSAPVFEDLLDGSMTNKVQPPPPPNNEAIEMILGLDGLSDEEKRQLIQEQMDILAQIEATKSTSAQSRADAFESRSHAAAVQAIARGGNIQSNFGSSAPRAVQLGNGEEVALQGQDATKRAIAEGTAVLVQCLACENWMQVTREATMMFCPVCQTVSPVVIPDHSSDEAAQLKADLELAERLQQEEYDAAERAERRSVRGKDKEAETPASSAGGWMEWLGLSSAPAPSTPERPMSFAEAPVQRGQIGTSRPPGASSTATSPPRLTAAQTETITFSPSADDEEDALLSGGRARVAESKPLFSCVADSITSSVTSLSTALNTVSLGQDHEGNVHGIDSSSLLAVPNVGRETNYQQLQDRE